MMPTIGLAMIVKNGSANIAQALVSSKCFCSQLLVVDTGSDDETPLICKKIGAEVHFFEWTGSFSDARNHALRLMRSDWILILDSDETLDIESFKNDIELFNNETIGGIRVKINNVLKDKDSSTIYSHRYTRIFRNLRKSDSDPSQNRTFSFTGRIHEQIAESIEKEGFTIVDSEIIINHYGYAEKNEDKIKRNKTMLEQEIAEKPNDDWLLFHLAETEFSGSNYEKAEEIYLSILNSKNLSTEQNEKSMLRLAQIALKIDNHDNVIKYTSFSSENADREGFRRFILGISLLINRDIASAAKEINSDECNRSLLVDKKQLEQTKELLRALGAMTGKQ